MKNWDKKESLQFLGIVLLTVTGLCLFWGRQGDVAVDTGREFYIPEQMLNGQVLYKDIFNIYGALAYQINMILYNFFGANTLTLHIAGNIAGLGIIILVYLIAKQFLYRFYAILIPVFTIFIGIFKMHIFNYTVPYSFAVTYGMLVVLVSLYCLLKYLKTQKNNFLYFSAFFAGTAFAFKYDFAPFLLIFPLVCYLQKESFKTFLKLVLIGLIIPIVSFSSVFACGVNFNDFINKIDLFRRIAQAPSLTYFYQNNGVFLNLTTFISILKNLSIFCLILLLWKFVAKKTFAHKATSYILQTLLAIILLTLIYKTGFTFIGIATLCLCLIKYNKIFTDKFNFICLIALILLSIKSIFICKLGFYGIYSFPFLLMALTLVLSEYYFKGQKYLKLILALACIILLTPPLKSEFTRRGLYKSKIETQKGWISSATNKTASALLVNFILEKTDKNDKIVILPEGHMINFLTNRKSDDYYGNLIPMYVESLGENKIINHYKQNKPEYFVITDRDMTEYGKQYICLDYASNLCNWIFENYHVVYKILGAPEYTVLRKNE